MTNESAAPVGVTVCRGCCCGDPAKHPDVDHDAQLEALRAMARSGAVRLTVSECLGPCEEANVVVVRPSAPGRRAGGRPRWFGSLTEPDIAHLGQWVRAGGPGRAELPPDARLRQLPRPSGT